MAHKLLISKNGEITTVYSPKVAAVLSQLGDITIKRASHVEPGAGLALNAKAALVNANRWSDKSHVEWFADLTPIHGPILGPFVDNAAAVAAEVEYINTHLSRIDHGQQ